MIDWLMFLFFQLTIIDFVQIVTLNLLITVISRIYYLLIRFYYCRNVLTQPFVYYHRKFFYYLLQVLIVLVSIILLPFTLFTSIFSIFLGSHYLKKIGEQKSLKYLINLSSVISITVTLFTSILAIILNDLFSIVSISLALILYLILGVKIVTKALDQISKGIAKTSYKDWTPFQLVKGICLVALVAFSSIVITYSGLYSEPEPKEFFIEMRDGVKLATDVYFAPGSFGIARPVILVRTPYGKRGWAYDLYSDFYLTQQYHLVIQDLRGTFDSEGGTNFQLFTKSYQDGVDSINWLLSQSFCNGKIASVGVSALCINQYSYAGMGPQGLEAQSLWFGTPELFDHAIFQGSYHKSSVETWLKSTAPENWEFQRDLIFQYFPRTINFNSTSLSMPIGPQYSNVNVYGLHVGGWYDHFLQGTLDGYIGYDDYGTIKAQNHQKLIMGPWTHGAVFGDIEGELVYPDNANGFNLILDWETQIFDDALLGIPGRWDGARVAYYLMGDVDGESKEWNYWRYAYDWPLEHVNDSWYFVADGSLQKNDPGSDFQRFEYLYDPRFPVPNLGGQNQPFDLSGPIFSSA